MRRENLIVPFMILLSISGYLPAQTENQKGEVLCKEVGKLCAKSAQTEAEKQGFFDDD